jgi:hypothetical protein
MIKFVTPSGIILSATHRSSIPKFEGLEQIREYPVSAMQPGLAICSSPNPIGGAVADIGPGSDKQVRDRSGKIGGKPLFSC